MNKEIMSITPYTDTVPEMNVTLFSFGFKHDRADADTVFDVRFLPNPYYVKELSGGTGLDREVAAFVLNNDTARNFFVLFEPFLLTFINNHSSCGRSALTIAFGCTGGRHRSVAIAEQTRKILENHGIPVSLFHRDIEKQ